MPLPSSLSSNALRSLACAALLLPLAPTPAGATSMSSNTVVFTLTLVSATYVDDGTDAPLDSFGGSEDSNSSTTTMNGGTASGSNSFTVGGATPGDPTDFAFAVGDAIVATLNAQATADGPDSFGGHTEQLDLFLEFEDTFDGSRNIDLNFQWSYTRNFTIGNMTAGDSAAVFLDASVLITNFENFSDSFFVVENENIGTQAASTFMLDTNDAGSFSLLMDVEEGGATSSAVDFTLFVGANADIRVPEPSLLALLAPLGLAGASRRRNRRP